jgi:hypothetical protein
VGVGFSDGVSVGVGTGVGVGGVVAGGLVTWEGDGAGVGA